MAHGLGVLVYLGIQKPKSKAEAAGGKKCRGETKERRKFMAGFRKKK